jgi:hypothetical protein
MVSEWPTPWPVKKTHPTPFLLPCVGEGVGQGGQTAQDRPKGQGASLAPAWWDYKASGAWGPTAHATALTGATWEAGRTCILRTTRIPERSAWRS